jgi:hypothetical protein
MIGKTYFHILYPTKKPPQGKGGFCQIALADDFMIGK